jgi:hypothetical protein
MQWSITCERLCSFCEVNSDFVSHSDTLNPVSPVDDIFCCSNSPSGFDAIPPRHSRYALTGRLSALPFCAFALPFGLAFALLRRFLRQNLRDAKRPRFCAADSCDRMPHLLRECKSFWSDTARESGPGRGAAQLNSAEEPTPFCGPCPSESRR